MAFERLSARSVYRRFQHPVTALTSDALRQLTELDFRDYVAPVVTAAHEARERFIGGTNVFGSVPVVAVAPQRRGFQGPP